MSFYLGYTCETLCASVPRLLAFAMYKVPFGITLGDGYVFFSDWDERAIFRGNMRNGEIVSVVKNISHPMGLQFYKGPQYVDLTARNPCDNSDCSHICVPTRGGYRCQCPDVGGLVLTDDGKRCVEPDNFLLVADYNEIRMLSFDTRDTTAYPIIQLDGAPNIVALTYDPEEKFVYWSSVNTGMVSRGRLTGEEISYVKLFGGGIDGMAIDVDGRTLYWSDGIAGTIEMLDLGTFAHKVAVKDVDKPRAITMDPIRSYLFWSDWGKEPKIERASLSGGNRTTLVGRDLESPNGLAVDADEGRLYFADGTLRKIESIAEEGGNRREVAAISQKMDHIYGLAKVGPALFYSDWKTQSVAMTDLVTGRIDKVITDLIRPTEIHAHHPKELKVRCPSGTFYNETANLCQYCVLNNYQPNPGQTSCRLCPWGTGTAGVGAFDIKQCDRSNLPATERPRNSENTIPTYLLNNKGPGVLLFLYIAAGCVGFILLSAALAAICYPPSMGDPNRSNDKKNEMAGNCVQPTMTTLTRKNRAFGWDDEGETDNREKDQSTSTFQTGRKWREGGKSSQLEGAPSRDVNLYYNETKRSQKVTYLKQNNF
uniref:Tyrosine-protein kinase ephrin type A/B receptor-like domain-containing protein n=1 Tax=Branchiostoma floridae TaxID=7739 RepID=C3ZND9_BRAFL|eukprot:XP_002589956.1 hypothetical protein BRAFLDRAFT_105990 [Branchiostoma floridae]